MATYRRVLRLTKFDFQVRCKSEREMRFLQGKVLAARSAWRARRRVARVIREV